MSDKWTDEGILVEEKALMEAKTVVLMQEAKINSRKELIGALNRIAFAIERLHPNWKPDPNGEYEPSDFWY